MSRRSLSPSNNGLGPLAQRRGSGGARREISSRIVLRNQNLPEEPEIDGWALNISRGGIRVVIDGRVLLGRVYSIDGCDPEWSPSPQRLARVVWCQDEPDGSVVGMEFVDDDAVPSTMT